jgi:hypothetical protein
MAVVSDRVLASISDPFTEPGQISNGPIWQSLDWGETWQPVIGPDGKQIEGGVVAMGDAAAVLDISRYQLVWVGFPQATAATSDTPAAPIATTWAPDIQTPAAPVPATATPFTETPATPVIAPTPAAPTPVRPTPDIQTPEPTGTPGQTAAPTVGY